MTDRLTVEHVDSLWPSPNGARLDSNREGKEPLFVWQIRSLESIRDFCYEVGPYCVTKTRHIGLMSIVVSMKLTSGRGIRLEDENYLLACKMLCDMQLAKGNR